MSFYGLGLLILGQISQRLGYVNTLMQRAISMTLESLSLLMVWAGFLLLAWSPSAGRAVYAMEWQKKSVFIQIIGESLKIKVVVVVAQNESIFQGWMHT